MYFSGIKFKKLESVTYFMSYSSFAIFRMANSKITQFQYPGQFLIGPSVFILGYRQHIISRNGAQPKPR